ncbi:hypothetical protein SERLADRAFT_377350 [Serpula lacrymans var. lacrymans S7.9]|uniref:Uncharacterized protein n=1 Tax=Serpula lacrymans var. lacrymans (strain S7.9) TaxID=578457 RepID=F8NIW0_SERL9|nr:uncharacterized protein SERLADRAFT_377350 [Serpula lacrymans var. lacrymans S7.9]EGO28993.1 hypothetical protein SERLADRAFT_377350 [Serpula lacrymans var. lacrymans S7.9]
MGRQITIQAEINIIRELIATLDRVETEKEADAEYSNSSSRLHAENRSIHYDIISRKCKHDVLRTSSPSKRPKHE